MESNARGARFRVRWLRRIQCSVPPTDSPPSHCERVNAPVGTWAEVAHIMLSCYVIRIMSRRTYHVTSHVSCYVVRITSRRAYHVMSYVSCYVVRIMSRRTCHVICRTYHVTSHVLEYHAVIVRTPIRNWLENRRVDSMLLTYRSLVTTPRMRPTRSNPLCLPVPYPHKASVV
jgi:hypothetical protein